MIKKPLMLLLILAMAVITTVFIPRESSAIPVFARKYNTSCTTCHAPVPIKLNNFGQAFKNNGYRMPSGDEDLTKEPDMELGAEAWKENWPNTVWPGAIPSQVPLAFQIYLDARVDARNEVTGAKKYPKWWFNVPHEVELITAGTSGKHISWWSNIEFKADKVTGVDSNIVDIVQAWGQLDNLLDTSLFNVKFGKLEVGAVPFSRVTRRFIANDFYPMEFDPAGRFTFKTMQGGVELWGAKSVKSTGGGWQYAVGLVNGQGKVGSGTSTAIGSTAGNAGDDNNSKDVYGRLSYKFGGLGVARAIEETAELQQTENWIDNSLRVGVYNYTGDKFQAASGLIAAIPDAKFTRTGLDLDWWFGKLNLFGTYWVGKDEDVIVSGALQDIDSNSYFVSAEYILFPWITGILRYEGGHREDSLAVRRIIPATVVGIRPNITWTNEYVYFLKEGDADVKRGDDVFRTRLRYIF